MVQWGGSTSEGGGSDGSALVSARHAPRGGGYTSRFGVDVQEGGDSTRGGSISGGGTSFKMRGYHGGMRG